MDQDRIRAIQSEYEANISVSLIARKYGITPAKIERMAVQHGWVKRKPPTEEQVLSSVSLFSFDPNEQAVLSAANIVAIHRKDVARLRTISGILVDRLGIELSGQKLEDAEGNPLICRGGRESPADLLEKLSRVMVRTTEIERQAYGLKTFNPEQAATDAELEKELDELTAQVERIAASKKAESTDV